MAVETRGIVEIHSSPPKKEYVHDKVEVRGEPAHLRVQKIDNKIHFCLGAYNKKINRVDFINFVVGCKLILEDWDK